MLYKKNKSSHLDDNLFKKPTSEYRGTPFWAWNNHLTKDELCRQIEVFKQMGLGGFHMHVRTGLKNRYLSDEYMELVKTCVDKAKSENMLAWLYDEDRWPSGAAGGLVTQDERFRARNLMFTAQKDAESYTRSESCAAGSRSGKGTLLACYDVVLDKDGYLENYKRIDENDDAAGTKWYAFLEIHQPDSWYNDRTYLDTLNKDAVERFIQVTHERYKETIGDEFDKTVPAIFTDEPQFTRKTVLGNSFDTNTDIMMPWTDKVPQLYKETYGADIFETLPEIFWDLKDSAPSVHRYRYHDFIAELFASSFADTIGGWCDKNNLALTGHMMEEPTLRSQTAALGEAMRSYRSFKLPGIDLLCNSHEFTTAKQTSSAAHQFGYEGVLSELYGVTGWDCDFRTYKHQGDWQAALGITIRVPHLSWYAMEGEAKRDYPASISYQSPWYKEYNTIEDHFARLNTALTRGKPVVKVAVIHPIESFWLHWGPNDKSAVFRESCDNNFLSLTKWLLEGSIDFDFVSESLLPGLCPEASAPLKVGEMEYSTVIVPNCETLRSTTLERLENFRKAGGRVIFTGCIPTLCDAVKSERGNLLADKCEKIDFSRSAILTALEKDRTLTIRHKNGSLTEHLIYQLRKDNDCAWLFVCPNEEPGNKDLTGKSDIRISLAGDYTVTVYDTQNGETYPADVTYANGKTVINEEFYGYDSKLYKICDGKSDKVAPKKDFFETEGKTTAPLVEYELSEENVLLLDMAQFKLENEPNFSPEEEILRLDNICRERLGLRERGGQVVQPWVYGEREPVSKVTLKYTFESETEYDEPYLALENAAQSEIVFNGQSVDNTVVGNFVDISVFKVKLPKINKGENTLLITLPFGDSANLENVFILGNFGVKLCGRKGVVIALPQKIGYGDLVHMGFPFYGGNITYKIPVEVTDNSLKICASDYRGALICAKLDSEDIGKIIYPPYCLYAKGVGNGKKTLELTLNTHRYNTFGPVHLVNEKESWHGPNAWRSTKANWSYEYVLRKTGILKAPVVE